MHKLAPRLFNWASILDDATAAQAKTASTMPFIHPHLALMPDAHLGKGATVGSVIPTLGAIMPAAVGVETQLYKDFSLVVVFRDWYRSEPASYVDTNPIIFRQKNDYQLTCGVNYTFN